MASPDVSLQFHGAAGTVTGSKHLLEVGGTRILLDAGMFQGEKRLRLLNWRKPAFDVRRVEAVLLTHTHIDHLGMLPRLARYGLRAPVHASPAAVELAPLMLLDAAKIQEEDARWANRRGFSRHRPALPLFDTRDARRALRLLRKLRYNTWLPLGPGGHIHARLRNSGHILGAGFVEVRVDGGRRLRFVYSGDIGRFDMPLHLDPRPMPACDVLVIESTYGDRRHPRRSAASQLAAPLRRCLRRGGTALIPAFAVGRSQQITLVLRRLMLAGQIPEVPIHIDSPMATNATRIYSRFLDRRNVDEDVFEDGRLRIFPRHVELHRTVAQSRRLNDLSGPRIIVSSSGMLTGGRVLHHLARLAPDRRNLVLLAGHQASGTRGRALAEGAPTVRIHGQDVPIRAEVVQLSGLSGHADRDELLRWIASAPTPPRQVHVVHGEPGPARSLADAIRKRFGARVHVARLGEKVRL